MKGDLVVLFQGEVTIPGMKSGYLSTDYSMAYLILFLDAMSSVINMTSFLPGITYATFGNDAYKTAA